MCTFATDLWSEKKGQHLNESLAKSKRSRQGNHYLNYDKYFRGF